VKDDDLREKLAAFVVPPATETARDRARYRALIAFRQPVDHTLLARSRSTRWSLAAGVALALLAVLFWPRDTPLAQLSANATVLVELATLFPGELDAVIDRHGELQLALSPAPQRPSDQALLVEFRRGPTTVRVLTYSGRWVCVDLAGRRACFEALASARGEVVIAGEDFVWTAQEPVSMDGWNITAAGLENAS